MLTFHSNLLQNYIQSKDELLTLKKCQNRRFFGNFSQLVNVLREEVEISPEGRHSPENISLVSKILEQIEFNPKYVNSATAHCCLFTPDQYIAGNGSSIQSSRTVTTQET